MINRIKPWVVTILVVLLVTSVTVTDSLAQRQSGTSRSSSASKPPIEISATYGSMWGGNISTFNGTLRTATGPSYGFAIDIPLHPAAALELSYTRQDGALDWDTRGSKETLTNMSVNYWQIGAIRGLIDGKVRPFISTSIGATYYSPADGTVTFDEDGDGNVETYNVGTSTKLSFILGVGVKSYFGQAEKIGIRASFKVLPTLYNTSGGVWFGTSGASLGITGNAIWQWEAAIGLTVKLGG